MNSLEFLAALIGIWVENELGSAFEPDDVLLCQGDSSSATGWLAKSSFGDECPLLLAISRLMAGYLNKTESRTTPSGFPGRRTRLSIRFPVTFTSATSSSFLT